LLRLSNSLGGVDELNLREGMLYRSNRDATSEAL
jgi:hypothetical protein